MRKYRKYIKESLRKGIWLPIKGGKLKIVSSRCVNSNWKAKWLAEGDEKYCQCSFECKIKILLAINGHSPYGYIITEKELYDLLESEVKK